MRHPPVLSRRLVLEAAERQPDGAGGFLETWVPLGTLWAAVSSNHGGAGAGQDLALSRMTHKIVVRGAPAGSDRRPLAGQRFKSGQRVFRIRSVSELDAMGHYLSCLADEENAR